MNKTLLIVDDEIYIRQSFADFFEDQGWHVSVASSGEEALEILTTRTCQVAVVDIRMGGMDGEAFIRKAVTLYPHMRFVVCTGSPEYLMSSDLTDMVSVAGQVVSKPVSDLGALETSLMEMLRQ